VENLLTPPTCLFGHVGGVLVDGMQPETKTRPQMGHVLVSGWRVGLEENHWNTKNAPHRACFSCSVGVLRVGEQLGRRGWVLVGI